MSHPSSECQRRNTRLPRPGAFSPRPETYLTTLSLKSRKGRSTNRLKHQTFHMYLINQSQQNSEISNLVSKFYCSSFFDFREMALFLDLFSKKHWFKENFTYFTFVKPMNGRFQIALTGCKSVLKISQLKFFGFRDMKCSDSFKLIQKNLTNLSVSTVLV